MTFDYTDYLSFVDSTALQGAWYNSNTGDLVVGFNSGTLAGYRNFDKESWRNFGAYPSAGQYYTYYVKNRYQGFSVDKDALFINVSTQDKSATKFKVTAAVSSDVTTTVEAVDLEDAIKQFRSLIEDAMKGNPVTISFKSAVAE